MQLTRSKSEDIPPSTAMGGLSPKTFLLQSPSHHATVVCFSCFSFLCFFPFDSSSSVSFVVFCLILFSCAPFSFVLPLLSFYFFPFVFCFISPSFLSFLSSSFRLLVFFPSHFLSSLCVSVFALIFSPVLLPFRSFVPFSFFLVLVDQISVFFTGEDGPSDRGVLRRCRAICSKFCRISIRPSVRTRLEPY